LKAIQSHEGSRGPLPNGATSYAEKLVEEINRQPISDGGESTPSLTVVIGESETAITGFIKQVVQRAFEDRRLRSLMFPLVSFVFDEADVFIGRREGTSAEGEGGA